MSAARCYQRYPEAVKIQVGRTRNPYLFPEYKIPRTTANYWIKIATRRHSPISEGELVNKRIKTLEKSWQGKNP